jgi:hypothetical protein
LTSRVNTERIFMLMCIIQNMFRYYIIETIDVNLLKTKIMKLAYTRKTTFNINGSTIHSTLAIPLNKKNMN